MSSCATVKTSWYDEAAGRKRVDARSHLQVIGRLFRALDNLGRAASGAVEAAAASAHVKRVGGALSFRRSAQKRCQDTKSKVRNRRKGLTRRCIKLALTRASGLGLGLGASGVGFGLLRQREVPGG